MQQAWKGDSVRGKDTNPDKKAFGQRALCNPYRDGESSI
jgi:hypothetical protein